MDFQSATLVMDTTNNIFVPLFVEGGGFGIPEMSGYPDSILVPGPDDVPGAAVGRRARAGSSRTCTSQNGRAGARSRTRQIMQRRSSSACASAGYDYVAGLEVEFYITKLEDPRLAPEQSG